MGMGAIDNIALIEAAVGRWKPPDVAFIRELRFFGLVELEDGTATSRVALCTLLQPRPPLSKGWPDPRGSFWEVRIEFDGVRELKINQGGSGDIQVQGFDIEDHSRSQMEGVSLRVLDYESHCISFWARSARVVSCTRSTTRPTSLPYCRIYPIE